MMKKNVTLLLVLALLAQLFLIPGLAEESGALSAFDAYTSRELAEGETLRYGVDVSEYQGDIDWQTVAESGISFAFIRLGSRSYSQGIIRQDDNWLINLDAARAAGIKVGVYFYSQAITTAEAEEEAAYVTRLLSGYPLDLPVVIDFEYADYNDIPCGRLYRAGLSNQERTDICNAFCSVVEKNGYAAAVYATASMLQDEMNAEELDCVWLAHNTTSTSYSGSYSFWQCAWNGRVPGISVAVDLDFWYDSTVPETESELPFVDVSADDWCYDAILGCYQQGILNGVTEDEFAPIETVSRGQFLTMLYHCAGDPVVSMSEANTAAKSVTDSSCVDPVVWARSKSIISGSYAAVHTDTAITRQELVLLLYRYAGKPKTSGSLASYTDVSSVSNSNYLAMLWAVQNGIIAGDSGMLQPTAEATRAEAAVILARYLALMSES